MISKNGAVTEHAKIAGIPKVGTVNTTPLVGNAVDMSKFSRVDFILATGTLNASETADALVQTDTASDFSDTPATLAQTTAEVVSDDQVAIISVKSEDLPEGDRYARMTATGSGVTGGPACIMALGVPRYADQGDATPIVPGEIDAVRERIFA